MRRKRTPDYRVSVVLWPPTSHRSGARGFTYLQFPRHFHSDIGLLVSVNYGCKHVTRRGDDQNFHLIFLEPNCPVDDVQLCSLVSP